MSILTLILSTFSCTIAELDVPMTSCVDTPLPIALFEAFG